MITIRYTKRFTTGLLKGLRVPNEVSFPRPQDAQRFKQAMASKQVHRDAITNDKWVLEAR